MGDHFTDIAALKIVWNCVCSDEFRPRNCVSRAGGKQMLEGLDFHVGKRIRRRRKLMGLTQAQLGKICGVRFQQIQKYECAASKISAVRLYSLALGLEVEVQYFFEDFVEPDESTLVKSAVKKVPDFVREVEVVRVLGHDESNSSLHHAPVAQIGLPKAPPQARNAK